MSNIEGRPESQGEESMRLSDWKVAELVREWRMNHTKESVDESIRNVLRDAEGGMLPAIDENARVWRIIELLNSNLPGVPRITSIHDEKNPAWSSGPKHYPPHHVDANEQRHEEIHKGFLEQD